MERGFSLALEFMAAYYICYPYTRGPELPPSGLRPLVILDPSGDVAVRQVAGGRRQAARKEPEPGLGTPQLCSAPPSPSAPAAAQ